VEYLVLDNKEKVYCDFIFAWMPNPETK
jgi:hypothetical protein